MKGLLGFCFLSALLTTACLETHEEMGKEELHVTSSTAEDLLKLQSQTSSDMNLTIPTNHGASLECKTCFADRNSCLSGKEACEPGQDTCVIRLTETSQGGKTMSSIEKGCDNSKSCTSAHVLVTLGQGEYIRKSTICCLGKDCKEDSLLWPPISKTTNGKSCPACYAEDEPCPTKITQCTGSDNHCLDLMVHKYPEKTITLKGCTAEHTCNALLARKLDFLDTNTADPVLSCRPANQVSQRSGNLLFSLFGLLLVKVLL